MPVGTSNGEYYEDSFDAEHAMMFGGRPGVYNPKSDTWSASPVEDEKKDNKLFLVRHGDTQLNDEDRVHGWTTQPLNEKGVKQSQNAAQSLSDKNITNIVSSDLPRAKQTANIISRETGAPITINPNLRTWDTGYLDGSDAKEAHDLIKKHPLTSPDTPLPGGSESFNEFKDRVISAVSGIASKVYGNTVIVSHSKPIGVIDGWEKNGFSKDGSVHMDTYEDSRCRPTTGGHQELELPQQAAEAAAKRIKGAVLHGADQPSEIALGRGMQYYAEKGVRNFSEAGKQLWSDLRYHPENFIGPGELGIVSGKIGAQEFGKEAMKALSEAKHMAYNTIATARDIFKKTGWFKDPIDKEWKRFINNKGSDLIGTGYTDSPGFIRFNSKGKMGEPIPPEDILQILPEKRGTRGTDQDPRVRLSDVLKHDELYKYYPWLKDVEIQNYPGRSEGEGTIFQSPAGHFGIKVAASTKQELLNAIHHEIQHLIQIKEGFPYGKSSKDVPWLKYLGASGEVEARNASYWNTVGEFKNAGITPFETYGIDINRKDIYKSKPAGSGVSVQAESNKAALKVGDKIYTGQMHFDAANQAIASGERLEDVYGPNVVEGFVNDKGKFLTRDEASLSSESYKPYKPKPYEGMEANIKDLHEGDVVKWRNYMEEQIGQGKTARDIAKTLKIPETDVQLFINRHFK